MKTLEEELTHMAIQDEFKITLDELHLTPAERKTIEICLKMAYVMGKQKTNNEHMQMMRETMENTK